VYHFYTGLGTTPGYAGGTHVARNGHADALGLLDLGQQRRRQGAMSCEFSLERAKGIEPS
jgi:hypothetical protein